MRNLNLLLKMPVLQYEILDKSAFEKEQIEKLLEEMNEFKNENDYLKKCCELLDLIQVSLSFLELFNVDIIDQCFRMHIEKMNKRKKHKIKGSYEIFRLLNKHTGEK